MRSSPIKRFRAKSRGMKFVSVLAIPALLASMACAGCASTAVSVQPGMCGWVVGDGQSGRGANIHYDLFPNSVTPDLTNEDALYIPCGPRNFLINNGTVKNANGAPVGDKFTLTQASMKSLVVDGAKLPGEPVLVASSTYWTPSEGKLDLFYALCAKYGCAKSDQAGGEANFSTPGWNGMLGENLGPSIERSIQRAILTIGDNALWQNHDRELADQVSKLASSYFPGEIRKTTGVNADLFCGSGNSRWANEAEHTGWYCSPVRIVVDRVDTADPNAQANANEQAAIAQQKIANQARVAQAKILYGNGANFWLGLQDVCAKAKNCIVNVGGGSVGVVPSTP